MNIPDTVCVCCSEPAVGLFGPQSTPMCNNCWALGKLVEWNHKRDNHENDNDPCQDCDVQGYPSCNLCVGSQEK